jgi:NADH dehydrogenase
VETGLHSSTAINLLEGYKKDSNKSPLLEDGLPRVQLQDQHGQKAVLKNVFALGDNAVLETGAPCATA